MRVFTSFDPVWVIAQFDPSTMIPIGTVTGMLVAVFVLFIRDSARNDQRADLINTKLVQGAEAERDRAKNDLEHCRQHVEDRETFWRNRELELLRHIAHQDRLLYAAGIEPPKLGDG